MKTIKNKELLIASVNPEGQKIETKEKYFELIKVCINYRKDQQGYEVADMRKRIKLLDLFEGKIATIEVEDAEMVLIKEYVTGMDGNWAILDKGIIDFCDYIESIK